LYDSCFEKHPLENILIRIIVILLIRESVMKKLLTMLAIGILLLSFNAAAGWQKLWNEPVSQVVVNHDQNAGTTDLFAVKKSSREIYEYQGTPDDWQRIGTASKMYAAAGGDLFKIDPGATGVFVYSGQPDLWRQIGGPAAKIYGGGGKLYATNPDTGDIYEYKGQPYEWIKIGGPGKTFAAAGAYGTRVPGPQGGDPGRGLLFGISPGGEAVWKYSGSPEQWQQIGGPAKQIYAGGIWLYATEPETGDIYQYSGTPDSWYAIGMPGKDFAIDVTGCGQPPLGTTVLYGLSGDGKQIWKYDGQPDQWTQIKTSGFSIPLKSIHAGGGNLYAVTENDILYKYRP
jgi:hypothetical protein